MTHPTVAQLGAPGGDQEWRESPRALLVEGAAAPSTQYARQCAWRQWQQFSAGSGAAERLDDSEQSETLILDWVAHLAFVRRMKASTIKGKFGHVNGTHMRRGWGAPVDGFKRLRLALQTLRRADGSARRKHPAGPPILRGCLDRVFEV